MRILQLIDSLDAGGAERMAVNYANALSDKIEFSGLVVTRKEGVLYDQVNKKVSYLFLNKKRTIDFNALFALRRFVIENKVEIIHAHSTSFFLAFLLKISKFSVKVIWHDHYGDSEFLAERPCFSLRIILPFFSGTVSVNQNLKNWAQIKLKLQNVVYLPNFPTEGTETNEQTILFGTTEKRIVSLANLRVQKNHFLLIEVAKKLKYTYPDWTFHLIGNDHYDFYSQDIKKMIIDYNLEKTVFLYGSCNDIRNILAQSDIAILTSQSEGLPVALLEYGLAEKAVVATNVGDISLVIKNGINGLVVKSNSMELFYEALIKLINNDDLRSNFGKELKQTISTNYSEQVVINKYLKWINDTK